jgi:hypothetical protein
MSFGAGHIMDMINRMKQNRSMRQSGKFKDNREAINATAKSYQKPEFKKVSKEELEAIKTKIQSQAAEERKKKIRFYIGVTISFVILFTILLIIIN